MRREGGKGGGRERFAREGTLARLSVYFKWKRGRRRYKFRAA